MWLVQSRFSCSGDPGLTHVSGCGSGCPPRAGSPHTGWCVVCCVLPLCTCIGRSMPPPSWRDHVALMDEFDDVDMEKRPVRALRHERVHHGHGRAAPHRSRNATPSRYHTRPLPYEYDSEDDGPLPARVGRSRPRVDDPIRPCYIIKLICAALCALATPVVIIVGYRLYSSRSHSQIHGLPFGTQSQAKVTSLSQVSVQPPLSPPPPPTPSMPPPSPVKPLPPSPPPPTPPPAAPPIGYDVVNRLHHVFHNAKLGDDMRSQEDVGVYIHTFDEWEDPIRRWLPCPETCDADDTGQTCKSCSWKGDRISASVIHSQLGERPDRRDGGIPLVSTDGGIVLDAQRVSILCVYGADGATLNSNCRPRGISDGCIPGCGSPPAWCDIGEPLLANNCRCSFHNCNGPPRPYAPQHLGYVMEQHKMHGVQWKKPQFHSGYNEVVLDGDSWPAPDVILAFYVVEGGTPRQEAKTREAHRKFLEQHAATRSAADAPLLVLRPQNWRQPFAVLGADTSVLPPGYVRPPLATPPRSQGVLRPPPPPDFETLQSKCKGRIAYDNSCIPD